MKSTLFIVTILTFLFFTAEGQSADQYIADLHNSSVRNEHTLHTVKETTPYNKSKTALVNSRAHSTFNLSEYLSDQLNYPALAKENFVEGKVVATVHIDRDGQVQEVTILESLGFGCDEEVIKTLKNMPTWTPAIRNGVPVAQQVNIPVQFILQ